MDMVERVAMAMRDNPGTAELIQGEAEHLARVAIEALREPTDEMIKACDINIPTKGMITGVWIDMIDAALRKA